MGRAGLIGGKFEVQIDLAEKKIRAGAVVDEVGMLADPTQAGIARQCLFQHRRAVGKDPVAERPNGALDSIA